MKSLSRLAISAIAVLALGAAGPGKALAQDKVSVGVFPVSSSLPYFVALETGFFKEQNIEPEFRGDVWHAERPRVLNIPLNLV